MDGYFRVVHRATLSCFRPEWDTCRSLQITETPKRGFQGTGVLCPPVPHYGLSAGLIYGKQYTRSAVQILFCRRKIDAAKKRHPPVISAFGTHITDVPSAAQLALRPAVSSAGLTIIHPSYMAQRGSLHLLAVALVFVTICLRGVADAAEPFSTTSRRGLASTTPEPPPADASPPIRQHVSATSTGCSYILSTAIYLVFYEQQNTSGTVPCMLAGHNNAWCMQPLWTSGIPACMAACDIWPPLSVTNRSSTISMCVHWQATMDSSITSAAFRSMATNESQHH